MVAWGYEFYVLVLIVSILSALEDKIRIPSRRCNILYFCFKNLRHLLPLLACIATLSMYLIFSLIYNFISNILYLMKASQVASWNIIIKKFSHASVQCHKNVIHCSPNVSGLALRQWKVSWCSLKIGLRHDANGRFKVQKVRARGVEISCTFWKYARIFVRGYYPVPRSEQFSESVQESTSASALDLRLYDVILRMRAWTFIFRS